ncbi:unnamed protein product [Bursaphelenchus okinawaensis]|uniref:PARP catalytic domain-containing protein n=1 Tax=Bursaphelenchus okinawaensis TaxID=465554 RepID=A0A811L921_9BILA|nr:unnamed protein product [Bursaphelenchus okinawaensis]CAG9118337.1 unnamed protein product [Bursaphelenchus okinawaensis]
MWQNTTINEELDPNDTMYDFKKNDTANESSLGFPSAMQFNNTEDSKQDFPLNNDTMNQSSFFNQSRRISAAFNDSKNPNSTIISDLSSSAAGFGRNNETREEFDNKSFGASTNDTYVRPMGKLKPELENTDKYWCEYFDSSLSDKFYTNSVAGFSEATLEGIPENRDAVMNVKEVEKKPKVKINEEPEVRHLPEATENERTRCQINNESVNHFTYIRQFRKNYEKNRKRGLVDVNLRDREHLFGLDAEYENDSDDEYCGPSGITTETVDPLTGLSGDKLKERREKDSYELFRERARTLKHPLWKGDDEESITGLFDRLGVKDEDANMVRTFLYAHNSHKSMNWFHNYLSRNRGMVYTPHTFQILNVWTVDRPYDRRFRSELPNKMFLLHGLQKDHVYKLLKFGFECEEAYGGVKSVFKTAIYFQSCSTKAANYTVENSYKYERKADREQIKPRNGEVIYLLLCNVALGRALESDETIKNGTLNNLWKAYDSLRCVGLCTPLGKELEIPMGPYDEMPPDDKVIKTRSLFDDYCVKDPNHARINYLLEVRYREEQD